MQAIFQKHTCCLVVLIATFVLSVSSSHIPSGEPYSSHHYDPYSYGYDVEDTYGNKQWKSERSTNPHEVHGSYGYRDKNGIYREVTYVADKNGFRANIKTNEPGVKGTKDPASTNIDSYYSPPPPAPAAPVSHSSYVHQSPPVYTRHHQHSHAAPASSYYQR